MEPRPVPSIIADEIGIDVVDVGPPQGVDPDYCGTANMARYEALWSGHDTAIYMSYYQPTKEELEILNAGGLVQIQMVSHVVPHSAQVVSNG